MEDADDLDPSGSPLVVSDATATLPSPTGAAGPYAGPPPFDPLFTSPSTWAGGAARRSRFGSALLNAKASGLVQLTGRLSDPRLRAQVAVAGGQFRIPPTLLKIVKPTDGGDNTVVVNYPVAGADGLPGVETRVSLTAQANVSVSRPGADAEPVHHVGGEFRRGGATGSFVVFQRPVRDGPPSVTRSRRPLRAS